jgi:putative two-component system response regulator
MPEAKALGIIREGRGSHFDPDILDVFLDRLPLLRAIRARIAD